MMYLMDYHKSVLLNESIEGLGIKPEGVYVDVTFGGGGHSKAILEQLNNRGKLYAFDQDDDAQENTDLHVTTEQCVCTNAQHRKEDRAIVLKEGRSIPTVLCRVI